MSGHVGRCKLNPDVTKVFTCKYCGIQVTGKNSFVKHENHCNSNPYKKSYKISTNKKDHTVYVCKFCKKECYGILSLRAHERLCYNNPDRALNNVEKGILKQSYWNKGLTKEDHPSILKQSSNLKSYYHSHLGPFQGKHHSEETKSKLSKYQIEYWHQDDNRRTFSKSGWYDGVYFMSSWELAYYIYQRDHEHKIQRCNQRFKYLYKDKEHYYYPDFIVDDHIIVEIKGFETPLDILKYSTVPNICVIRGTDIYQYVEYVQTTYGVKDITDLYDKTK